MKPTFRMTPLAWKILVLTLGLGAWAGTSIHDGRAAPSSSGGRPDAGTDSVRVDDRAGVLPASDRLRMALYLRQIEAETRIDIRLLFTVPPDGEPLDVFAAREATRLGIGRASGLRGLLVVYDPEARRMRVEVGYGLEEYFPDAFVGELLEEQVAWHFQAGDPAKLHLMLRIMHWRIRDHMLGGRFDPLHDLGREDHRYVSGGAGAAGHVPQPGDGARDPGTMRGFRTPLADEIRARFGAQPTPEAAFERYMEWLGLGRHDARIGLFTSGSQAFLQDLPLTPPYMAFIRRNMAGEEYRVARRGDRALLYFTTTPLVSPLFFREDGGGWRVDTEQELHCSTEFAGGYVTWSLMEGCPAVVAFDTLLARLPDGVIRVRGGDNRPLPTPEMQERKGEERAIRWSADVMTEPTLPAADAFGYPPAFVDKTALVRLLRDRRWDELASRLRGFREDMLRDVRYEYHVVEGYQVFRRVAVGRLLEDWVAARPDAPEAWLARATHQLERAWDARGHDWARDTPDEAFRAMFEEVERGHRALDSALALDPRLPHAYDLRMGLHQLDNDTRAARRAFEAGLEIAPLSVRLREQGIFMLLPRWGGSYAAMRRVADVARPLYRNNPRLATLAGQVDNERGRSAEGEEALEAFDRALRYGDEQYALRNRARQLAADDRWDLALADLNRAWMQRPEHPDVLKRRAWALYALARRAVAEQQEALYDRAEADARLAQGILPDRDMAKLLDWIRQCRDWPEGCSRPGA